MEEGGKCKIKDESPVYELCICKNGHIFVNDKMFIRDMNPFFSAQLLH